jgi:hypothetical protein
MLQNLAKRRKNKRPFPDSYTYKRKGKKGEKIKKFFRKPKKTKTSFYLVDYHPSCQRSP